MTQALPVYLITIPDTRKAIKAAKLVLIQPRYGCSEAWVKVSKQAALDFLSQYNDDATVEHSEMFGQCFASVDGETVFLG